MSLPKVRQPPFTNSGALYGFFFQMSSLAFFNRHFLTLTATSTFRLFPKSMTIGWKELSCFSKTMLLGLRSLWMTLCEWIYWIALQINLVTFIHLQLLCSNFGVPLHKSGIPSCHRETNWQDKMRPSLFESQKVMANWGGLQEYTVFSLCEVLPFSGVPCPPHQIKNSWTLLWRLSSLDSLQADNNNRSRNQ